MLIRVRIRSRSLLQSSLSVESEKSDRKAPLPYDLPGWMADDDPNKSIEQYASIELEQENEHFKFDN